MPFVLMLPTVLYLAACPVPAFSNGVTGFGALLFGWIGLPAGIVAWLANPLWLIAQVLSLRPQRGPGEFAAALVALAFGATVFLTPLRIPDGFNGDRLVSLSVGSYLWLTALAVQCCVSWTARTESSVD